MSDLESKPETSSVHVRPRTRVAMDRIVKAVASAFSVATHEIYGRDGQRKVSEPRQLCCWLAHRGDDRISLSQIGAALGGRDASTVFQAIAATQKRLDNDMAFRLVVDEVEQALFAGEELVLAGKLPKSQFDTRGALEVDS